MYVSLAVHHHEFRVGFAPWLQLVEQIACAARQDLASGERRGSICAVPGTIHGSVTVQPSGSHAPTSMLVLRPAMLLTRRGRGAPGARRRLASSSWPKRRLRVHAAAVRSAAAPVAIAERGGADDGHGAVTSGGAAVLFPRGRERNMRRKGRKKRKNQGYVA
jgi:hypothetical protein